MHLPTLVLGLQDAVSLSHDHLEEVCARSLTKAVQVKIRLSEFLLGSLKAHTLWDLLLHSDVLHAHLFSPESLESAVPLLKTAMDANTVCDHAGWIASVFAPLVQHHWLASL